MLTLAPIRTLERVVDHFAPTHRYGGAMRPAAPWFGKGAALKGLCNPANPACLLPLLDVIAEVAEEFSRGFGQSR